ncbi:MAG: hypothetical protein KC486_34515, partial [Myxococcales bacterium]|nr:hypothetical protein [Myxococcales bacterium]
MSARWDEHKAWFTPSDLGEQGLWAAKAVGVEPDVVIDLGAGAGGILCRVANVWPDARRVAIEIREEERRHLDRWAHEVVVGDFRELRRDHPALRGRRRLVVGNPPYGAPEGEAVDLTTQALAWALEEVLGVDDWVHFLLRKSYEE